MKSPVYITSALREDKKIRVEPLRSTLSGGAPAHAAEEEGAHEGSGQVPAPGRQAQEGRLKIIGHIANNLVKE